MKFFQHYSGSKGNFYEVVSSAGDRLLIDPGISWPNIQKALSYDLNRIVGCLISHEHQDHCKAVENVLINGIDVYASHGTISAMGFSIDHRKIHVLETIRQEEIGSFRINSYPANHDAEQPLLFRILSGGEKLLYATDTAFIKQRFETAFDIIAIECSFDDEWLREKVEAKEINKTLAERLTETHYSKNNCLAYLNDKCDLSRCKEIHLIHMSGDNIEKKRTAKEFKEQLFVKVKVK